MGLTVEPQVLALVRARFLWHILNLERAQEILDGVKKGPVGPRQGDEVLRADRGLGGGIWSR